MLKQYNTLRQTYIVDGFNQAYAYILEVEAEFAAQDQPQQHSETSSPSPKTAIHQILLTNFYCYITIQSEFKQEEILAVLEECLHHPLLEKPQSAIDSLVSTAPLSLKALTLYHIASVHFKCHQYKLCLQKCQQIIQTFIAEFYILQKRLEKSQWEKSLMEELQEILYYSFLMIAYCSKKEGNVQWSRMYLDAGKRIIRDRQDVLALTTASSSVSTPNKSQRKESCKRSKTLETEDSSLMERRIGGSYEKQNGFNGGGMLREVNNGKVSVFIL